MVPVLGSPLLLLSLLGQTLLLSPLSHRCTAQALIVPPAAALPAGPRAIETSLDTMPTGYFGGSGATGAGSTESWRRTDAQIAELAKQRVIVIEKWEGPCWDECLANSSRTPPIACSPGAARRCISWTPCAA